MSRRVPRGFTLVEVLVALGLFALTAVIGYRGLTALLEGRAHLAADDRRWRDLGHLYALWRSDLEAAADRPARDSGGLTEESLRGDFDSGGSHDAPLWLTRLGAPGANGPRAAPQRVGWRLREHRLERLTWVSPDRGPRSDPSVDTVLEGVSALSLRYLALSTSGPGWDSRWRAPAHVGLPRAVEITLDLDDGRHLVRTFDLPAAP